MEKIIKYKNLIQIIHKLYCDDCNIELEDTGIVIATYPPKYVYECSNCHNKMYVNELYPWEEYIGEEINE